MTVIIVFYVHIDKKRADTPCRKKSKLSNVSLKKQSEIISVADKKIVL